MTEPLRGNELLRAVVNHIIDDPESWDQVEYHSWCGTKHCIAGWAQVLGGADVSSGEWRMSLSLDASSDAMKFLELTSDEACWLFSYDRTFDEIHEFAKARLEVRDYVDPPPPNPKDFPKL